MREPSLGPAHVPFRHIHLDELPKHCCHPEGQRQSHRYTLTADVHSLNTVSDDHRRDVLVHTHTHTAKGVKPAQTDVQVRQTQGHSAETCKVSSETRKIQCFQELSHS